MSPRLHRKCGGRLITLKPYPIGVNHVDLWCVRCLWKKTFYHKNAKTK